MSTIKHLAVSQVDLGRGGDTGRIERNLFAQNGETFEALRFCKNRNGHHNRVHLVLSESAFARLFEDAVQKKVFAEDTLTRLLGILLRWQEEHSGAADGVAENPFLKVIGLFNDGHLTEGIDEYLYGDRKD
ncbi:MAG TPA: hypothetical protein VJX29_09875 [Candidatus Acidoferrales bacterium]|nr:hypothetical protein [Candidatus Acidoferrales bacterium]